MLSPVRNVVKKYIFVFQALQRNTEKISNEEKTLLSDLNVMQGTPVYDPSFDLADPAAQLFSIAACETLRKKHELVRTIDSDHQWYEQLV